MFGLIRVGAYLVSTFTIWQFFQGDIGGINGFSLQKHLVLDPAHGMIFGVCAGFSNFTGIDVSLIRLAWFIATLYRGLGILIYILAFLIMPIAG
ncbi:MAG: phage shock protein PspC [Firmicutes bacterium]|nr:phage shock protein PspC [Bacillota bacterium]